MQSISYLTYAIEAKQNSKMTKRRNMPIGTIYLLRRQRFYLILVLVCLLLMFLNYMNLTAKSFALNPRKSFTKQLSNKQAKYGHLRSLKEMFHRVSKETSYRDCRRILNISDLEENENKPNVLVVVMVITAPSRMRRRQAVRETWWKKCEGKVVCKFFTDAISLTDDEKLKLADEQLENEDIEFQPVSIGRNFGLRFLYQVMYATAKYHFRYLLRVDDDYFVCLERLFNELDYRPDRGLIWGSYHCAFKDRIYMDDAWMLFSTDVIERFLSQDSKEIRCHPHADQQIAVWINILYKTNETLVKFHDRRLQHYPPAREIEKFKTLTGACDHYVGIHGVSPVMMRKLWKNSSDSAKEITHIMDVSRTCRFPVVFNISKLRPPYKFDLRPCIENPIWTPNEGMWLGVHFGAKKTTDLGNKYLETTSGNL